MQRKRKAVEKALEAKGFHVTETHHKLFRYVTRDGRKTDITTRTSHGASGKDIQSNLLAQMAKQTCLSRDDFLDLVDCPLSREGYEAHLVANGVVDTIEPASGE